MDWGFWLVHVMIKMRIWQLYVITSLPHHPSWQQRLVVIVREHLTSPPVFSGFASLDFYVILCRSLFGFFFFWPLWCLFFYLWLLITPLFVLVSSSVVMMFSFWYCCYRVFLYLFCESDIKRKKINQIIYLFC